MAGPIRHRLLRACRSNQSHLSHSSIQGHLSHRNKQGLFSHCSNMHMLRSSPAQSQPSTSNDAISPWVVRPFEDAMFRDNYQILSTSPTCPSVFVILPRPGASWRICLLFLIVIFRWFKYILKTQNCDQ